MTPAVLMSSGGLDSTVLAWWLHARAIKFQPLFLDYGQTMARTERSTLAGVLPPDTPDVHVAHLADLVSSSMSLLVRRVNLWETPVTADELILPYRNLLFLAAGAAYAASIGATALYSAFINSNHALEIDATSAFLDASSALFAKVGAVEIKMPFRDLSKGQVARIGVDLGAPIATTYSCQMQADTHCGSCPNCVDRIAALKFDL